MATSPHIYISPYLEARMRRIFLPRCGDQIWGEMGVTPFSGGLLRDVLGCTQLQSLCSCGRRLLRAESVVRHTLEGRTDSRDYGRDRDADLKPMPHMNMSVVREKR